MKGLRVVRALRLVILGVIFCAARLEAWKELGTAHVKVPSSVASDYTEHEVKLWFAAEYEGAMVSRPKFYHVLGLLPVQVEIESNSYAAFDIKYDAAVPTAKRERQIYDDTYVPNHQHVCIVLWRRLPTPENDADNAGRQFDIPKAWSGELEFELSVRSGGAELREGLPAWLATIFKRACWLLDRRYGRMLDSVCVVL